MGVAVEMNVICALVLCLMVLSSAVVGQLDGVGLVCPSSVNTMVTGRRFHQDSGCDKVAYNRFKESLRRDLRYKSLKELGGVANVPDAVTYTCPDSVQQLHMEHQITGLDTVWIVENTASTPVVMAFINEDGIEVSAKNAHISPPQNDPTAILQPGEWMAIQTYEGHVFHARSLNEKNMMAGPIVLQHRVGLIPVGEHWAGKLSCPEQDVQPMVENKPDPHFDRTKAPALRACNIMDIGFRNKAGCPLNGYFVLPSEGKATGCTEQFKFHLGVEKFVPDFKHDWTSETKFEGTFIGHTFSFRLANNPSVLIDTVTFEPTRIVDCHNLRTSSTVVAAASRSVSINVENGEAIDVDDNSYSRGYAWKYDHHNDTSYMYQILYSETAHMNHSSKATKFHSE